MLNENERIKLIRLKLDMKHYKKAKNEDIRLILGSTVLAVMAVAICLLMSGIWGL